MSTGCHCPNERCPGLARDGVVAEYVDGVERCLDCGVRLIPGPPPPPPDPAFEYNDLRTVFIASGVAQGQIVAGAIEAAGIPVFVKGAMLEGAIGELPATVAQVELQVPVERVDDALEITRRWERGD